MLLQRISMRAVIALYGPTRVRCWFDRRTMRFFQTKLPGVAVATPHGNYFITSEQHHEEKAKYTVRAQDLATGDITTVGNFNCYSTYLDARQALFSHINQCRYREAELAEETT